MRHSKTRWGKRSLFCGINPTDLSNAKNRKHNFYQNKGKERQKAKEKGSKQFSLRVYT